MRFFMTGTASLVCHFKEVIHRQKPKLCILPRGGKSPDECQWRSKQLEAKCIDRVFMLEAISSRCKILYDPLCRTIASCGQCVFLFIGNRRKDWERMCVLTSLVCMIFLVQLHGATRNSAWEFPGTFAERRCHRCVHLPNDDCKTVQALFMETVHFGYPLYPFVKLLYYSVLIQVFLI